MNFSPIFGNKAVRQQLISIADCPGAEGQTNAYIMLPNKVYVEMQEDPGLSTEISGYHIHFITPDYEELLAWYTDVFSLEVRPRGSIATTTAFVS